MGCQGERIPNQHGEGDTSAGNAWEGKGERVGHRRVGRVKRIRTRGGQSSDGVLSPTAFPISVRLQP